MDRPRGSARTIRTALGAGLVTALVGLSPAACFFPDYTFNDKAGGSAGTATVGGGGAAGTMTNPTTGGGGTAGTTTGHPTTGGGGSGGGETTSTTGGGGSGGGTTSTTGGSGGSTGGGGSGGGTTSSTSTGMNPLEDCQNGVDDDGDLDVDCKDADCSDFSCIPSIPAGWMGYFELYEGTINADPFCNEDFPMESYVGTYNLNAPAAQCAACQCGAPQAQVCTPPPKIQVLDAMCGSSPSFPNSLDMPPGWGTCNTAVNASFPNGYYIQGGFNVCGPNQTSPCNVALTSAAPAVTGGFCAVSGGQANIPAAKWDNYARACGNPALTGKGCNINQVCLPKPPPPYVGGLCIKRAGDFMCPASQFNTKHVFYTDFTDSRTCTSCGCGAPAGSTCTGDIITYSDSAFNQCNNAVASFTAGGCVNLSGNPQLGTSKFIETLPPNGGTCAPSGGAAQGQATPTFPTTFCCINN